MKFMLLMYPNIPSEGWLPSDDAEGTAAALRAMGRFNDELSKAGVLLTLDGLHPPAESVYVNWDSGSAVAHDGPFCEVKEIVGGYWVIDVRSKDEAVEWVKRIPNVTKGQTVEIRQIQEAGEFPQEIQDALAQTRA